MTALPPWVHGDFSAELPILRARGEGVVLEYMAEFPSNATELAREIAALASTDGGRILLGVGNGGEPIGLGDTDTPQGRDRLLPRLEGVCTGQIKPSIALLVHFAVEDDSVILVIDVPIGDQPIYYSQGKPYVRNLTESRPAEPHEVIERVRRWLAQRVMTGDPKDVGNDASVEFLTETAGVIRDIQMWADELPSRSVNPGLSEMLSVFGLAAIRLRRLASSEKAGDFGAREGLEDLAAALEAVTAHQATLGRESWERFSGKVSRAKQLSATLQENLISTAEISPESREYAFNQLLEIQRRLSQLGRQMDEGNTRLSDIQADASALGRRITQLAYLGLDREGVEWVERLKKVGHDLHLVDMMRFTSGGREAKRLRALIEETAADIGALAAEHHRTASA